MRRARVLLVAAAAVVSFTAWGCDTSIPDHRSSEQIEVTFEDGGFPANGPNARLPLSFTKPVNYSVRVRALLADGSVDTNFNGYVRLSSKPGNVAAVTGPTANGRNVLLTNGVAENVGVTILAGYGNTRIWGEDVGYVPADPARVCEKAPCPAWCTVGQPCLPACSNGIDDNHNNLVDALDPGCFAPNDDTEDGGTFAAGVSPPIYYYVPRIPDVRSSTGTPFPGQAVDMDTGYRGAGRYAFSVIVTYVSAAGFYAADVNAEAPGGGGFGSVYAYNFSAPPNMKACDRLMSFGGTLSDFYGYTEVNYPTWELEEWDPTARNCGIPAPHLLAAACSTGEADCTVLPAPQTNSATMQALAASLVRLDTFAAYMAPDLAHPGQQILVPGTNFHIGAHFGNDHPCRLGDTRAECTGPGAPAPYTIDADHTNCDYNADGKIDRTAGSTELLCANACQADPECTEFSNYLAQNQFDLVVQQTDATGAVVGHTQILGNASTDPLFDPHANRGAQLRAFTGVLSYFSGGSQFTIEARCGDDVIQNLDASPIPPDTACVHARTTLDNQGSN